MTKEQEIAHLTTLFEKLGADDPAGWARSQVCEGIPQLARYLFLRQAWRRIVEENDASWIEDEIAYARRDPNGPYAGAGAALEKLRRLGASDEDLTDLVRAKQAQLLFHLCYLLGDPGVVENEVRDVGWVLAQVDDEGHVVGTIPCLHEDVLGTDPTGREMRPRRATVE